MAIQASKPNSRVFLLLGIVLAALAFGGVLFALRSSGGASGINIVVSKTAVPAGTTLTTDMVTTSSVPASAVPADAYTNSTTVVGKVTTVAIAQNTPLVPAFFSTPPLTSSTSTGSSGTGGGQVSVETQITKGFVALAIPAQATVPATDTANSPTNSSPVGLSGDLVSAGYYIQPGDHIDILADTGNGTIRYSFQDVPVLRVGTSGASSGTPSVFIVEVARNQAELLTALVTDRSHPFVIKYVLRPESSWGKMAPDGSSYTPNYIASGGPTVPTPADPETSAGALDSLFGH